MDEELAARPRLGCDHHASGWRSPALSLRCFDLASALESVASLFGITSDEFSRALPTAVGRVEADEHAPYPAMLLVPALADELGHQPGIPERVHYFHGTRTFEPDQIATRGLLPLSELIDDLWTRLVGLAPEVVPQRFVNLRAEIEAGRVDALNYRARVALGDRDDGPHGVLVRDVLLASSSTFLQIPETVAAICFAARNELHIALDTRYEHATTSCIVEFAVPPDEDIDQAMAAACWYIDAAGRHDRDTTGGDTHWNFSGNGRPVPAADIVGIERLTPPPR